MLRSILCLKPSTSWNSQGLEFCLTAYENPGVSLPASITTWVAMRGMPEFMEQLRKACLELRRWREEEGGDGGEGREDDPASVLGLGLPLRRGGKEAGQHGKDPSMVATVKRKEEKNQEGAKYVHQAGM